MLYLQINTSMQSFHDILDLPFNLPDYIYCNTAVCFVQKIHHPF